MQHVWQCGRAIENYLLPASAPVAMLSLNPVAASALTREVLQTLSVHFFPAAALGVAANDPKNISSTVGDGWIKWKEYSADGLKRVASKNKSAEMVKSFAVTLMSTMARIMPSVEATLLQLRPLRDQICDLYLNLSKQSERKSAFKTALEGHGSSGVAAGSVPSAEVWMVLPELLSFCASIAASKLRGKNDKLVDDCRDIISTAQHALCDMFFGYSGISCDVSPQQLLFSNADCPNGLVCLTVPDNPKSKDSPLTWTGVMCANCGRPAEHHALAVPHEKLQESPGQEHAQFVRALCRVGSIGWHPHRFMAAVHNERHGNLASFTPEACAASLSQYDQHVKCHCDCADSASTSCEKCKPYSLKKCCRALPHYTEAIKAEVIALQKSRREELEHVTRALSDPAATATASTPAKAAGGAASQTVSSSGVKKAGAAEPTVFPLADSPATPVTHSGTSVTRPPAAASPADANQHADQAVESQVVASCDPVSGVESACAVQPEVDPKAARLQQLFQQLRIADKSPEEQKQWIAAQPSLELAKLVPNKEQRTLLSEFARGAPVGTDKKDRGKKREPQVGSKPSDQSRESSLAAFSAVSTPASSPGPTSSPALAVTSKSALSPASAPSALVDSFSPAPGIGITASTAADDSLEGGVVASAPTAASLAPAEAAALSVLVSVFAAAGMVPSKDYPALAMKLISEGVADEIGLVDMIEEDPDFLKNAGMKAAQRSCLVRHLKRPPAAAGNAAAGGGA